MPACATNPFNANSSIAVRDRDADLLILGHRVSKRFRDKLRARGEWPKNFFIGSRSYVLRTDIDSFIEERQAATCEAHQRFSERGRDAVGKRWQRQRERHAAQAAPVAATR